MKQFDVVPVKKPAMNVFDLSHDVKATYNFDKLYPFLCQPVYPGDTWNCRAEVFMRAMPLVAPVMHNVDMRLYFFFVPNRLIWNENKKKDWKVFITGGEDGTYGPSATGDHQVILPYFTYSQLNAVNPDLLNHGSLLDHMGFPSCDPDSNRVIRNGSVPISQLPFRAYQLIYNEYFRNQNLQNEVEIPMDGGALANDGSADDLFSFRKKCFEKDYFTSCLPWAQRGVAMTLPISGDFQVSGSLPVSVNTATILGESVERGLVAQSTLGSPIAAPGSTLSAATSVTLNGIATPSGDTFRITGLEVGTINDFRYCMRLQQWMENNARCGSRYIEQLFSHFGVKSSDARLQRPELLGGGKVPIIFTDVEQTSYGQGGSDNVLGDLAGKGTLYGKTNGFKKYFEEHGFIIGILCIVPRTSYCQGIPRWATAMDKTDWYFPEFAHLGEQAVLNKEVYYNPTETPEEGSGPDDVFGYQGRFTELRYIPGSFHGDLRYTLQYWHFGRIFPSQPALNSSFVESYTRANVFALNDVAIGNVDPFICQMHLSIKAVRPLPKFAVPTL